MIITEKNYINQNITVYLLRLLVFKVEYYQFMKKPGANIILVKSLPTFD